MKRIQPRGLVATVALGAVLVLLVAAGYAAAGGGAQVLMRKTGLGRILVTGQGRTLYLFAIDKRGTSVCYGSCAHYWPPFVTKTKHVTGGTGVKASLLGTTKRKDGKLQVTYNGHPLYTYVGDAKAGQTTGEGLNLSGGRWWAMSPAGAAVKTPAPAPSSGGGYGG